MATKSNPGVLVMKTTAQDSLEANIRWKKNTCRNILQKNSLHFWAFLSGFGPILGVKWHFKRKMTKNGEPMTSLSLLILSSL